MLHCYIHRIILNSYKKYTKIHIFAVVLRLIIKSIKILDIISWKIQY